MRSWTDEAKRELDQYLEQARRALPPGEDQEEIVSGLHAHIVAEAESNGASVVGRAEVRRAINLLGFAEDFAPAPPPVSGSQNTPGWKNIWLAGVLLPSLAITMELFVGPMSAMYLDPMPTLLLFLLLLCVPVGFYQVLRIGQKAQASLGEKRSAFAIAGALTVFTATYSVVYLPTVFLAVIAILVCGLGFLGLSPHFALLAAVTASLKLGKVQCGPGFTRREAARWWGYGAGAMMLLAGAFLGRALIIERSIQVAADENSPWRATAVNALRWLRADAYVLERCLSQPGFAVAMPDEDGTGDADGAEQVHYARALLANRWQAQNVYFLLSGKSYRTAERPWSFSRRWEFAGRNSPPWEVGPVDRARGTEEIGQFIDGLSLAGSRLDATVFSAKDGTSGESAAYLEWILEFSNTTDSQQEARMLIHMPPGAVGSRLTLWIDGEEREAAFGGRDQVRNAYREVAVVQRRDPALLTSAGEDRLRLQCFPVPAHGQMKVKVGITAPLLIREGKAYLRMPEIADRKFTFRKGLTTTTWIESLAPLTTNIAALASEKTSDVYALRGDVALEEDAGWAGWAAVPAPALEAAPRTYGAALGEVQASMAVTPAVDAKAGVAPLWLLVDGGAAMAGVEIDWQAMLQAFPQGTEFHVYFAGLKTESLVTTEAAEAARWLQRKRYRGGYDPLPSLEAAWLEASVAEGGRLFWIHGPYPNMVGGSTAALEQALTRRPSLAPDGAPRIFDVQVKPGPNRVLEELGLLRGVVSVPVLNSVSDSVGYLAQHGRLEDVTRTYSLQATPGAEPASDHLVRLAVASAVDAQLEERSKEAADEARQLAQRTRLITPVTGAVVLEREEQYARHGLNPEENEDAIAQIPGIPEPEEWALIGVSAVGAAYFLLRRRRLAMAAA